MTTSLPLEFPIQCLQELTAGPREGERLAWGHAAGHLPEEQTKC